MMIELINWDWTLAALDITRGGSLVVEGADKTLVSAQNSTSPAATFKAAERLTGDSAVTTRTRIRKAYASAMPARFLYGQGGLAAVVNPTNAYLMPLTPKGAIDGASKLGGTGITLSAEVQAIIAAGPVDVTLETVGNQATLRIAGTHIATRTWNNPVNSPPGVVFLTGGGDAVLYDLHASGEPAAAVPAPTPWPKPVVKRPTGSIVLPADCIHKKRWWFAGMVVDSPIPEASGSVLGEKGLEFATCSDGSVKYFIVADGAGQQPGIDQKHDSFFNFGGDADYDAWWIDLPLDYTIVLRAHQGEDHTQFVPMFGEVWDGVKKTAAGNAINNGFRRSMFAWCHPLITGIKGRYNPPAEEVFAGNTEEHLYQPEQQVILRTEDAAKKALISLDQTIVLQKLGITYTLWINNAKVAEWKDDRMNLAPGGRTQPGFILSTYGNSTHGGGYAQCLLYDAQVYVDEQWNPDAPPADDEPPANDEPPVDTGSPTNEQWQAFGYVTRWLRGVVS